MPVMIASGSDSIHSGKRPSVATAAASATEPATSVGAQADGLHGRVRLFGLHCPFERLEEERQEDEQQPEDAEGGGSLCQHDVAARHARQGRAGSGWSRGNAGQTAKEPAWPRRAPDLPVPALRPPRLLAAGFAGCQVASALPSGRSLLVGAGLVAVAIGLYLIARQPSVFAVHELRVEGTSPALARRIEHEVASVRGHSLVTLDGDALLARVESLPEVRSASYDRAFPHSLVLTVVPERPAAVLRRGAEAWLLSTRGLAMGRLELHSHLRLPRIWVPKAVAVEEGKIVSDVDIRTAVSALPAGAADKLPIRIRTARNKDGELVFVLVNGLELRLGSPADVPLKLAVAREILPRLAAPAGGGPTYLDLGLPGKPVAGGTLNPEVEVEG